MKRSLALTMLVGAALAFTGPALVQGRTLAATDLLTETAPFREQLAVENRIRNPLQSDQLEQMPMVAEFWQELRAGHLKLWEPNVGGGLPLFTAVYNRVLAPWFAVFLVAPAAIAPTIAIFFGLLVAELSTYGLGRRLGLSRAGATFAAVAYAFSGPVLALLLRIHEALLLPAMLYAIHGAITAPKRGRYLVLLSVVTAGTWFCGFPFGSVVVLYVASAWSVYLLVHLTGKDATYARAGLGARARATVKQGWPVAAAVAAGTLIAAVQLLPTFEYLGATTALDREYPVWNPGNLPKLASAVSGRFFGAHQDGDWWRPITEGRSNPVEASMTVGMIVLLLISVLILRRTQSKATARNHIARFFVPLGLFVLIAVYLPGPWQAVVRPLPFMSNNSFDRARFVSALALALAAGLSVDTLVTWRRGARGSSRPLRAQLGVVLGVVAVGVWLGIGQAREAKVLSDVAIDLIVPALALTAGAVAIGILSKRAPRAAALTLIVAAAVELQWGAWGFTPASPAEFFYPKTTALSPIAEVAGPGKQYRFVAREPHSLWPNTAALLDVRDARYALPATKGYSQLALIIDPSIASRTTSRVKSRFVNLDPASPILDAMAVRYITTAPGHPPFDSERSGSVASRSGPLPSSIQIDGGGPVRAVQVQMQPGAGACLTGWVEMRWKGIVSRRLLRDIAREKASYFIIPDVIAERRSSATFVSTHCPVAMKSSTVKIFRPGGGAPLRIVAVGDWIVYERTRASPRASLATDVIRIDDEADRLDALRGRRSGARVVIVDGGYRDSRLAGGDARIIRDESERVDVEVTSRGPGLLVLRDVAAPGWSAKVNGRDATIARADNAFRAVEVPPGRSMVTFSYAPSTFHLGTGLAVAGVALTIFVGAWGRRRTTMPPVESACTP